jgi:hypothetical protein
MSESGTDFLLFWVLLWTLLWWFARIQEFVHQEEIDHLPRWARLIGKEMLREGLTKHPGKYWRPTQVVIFLFVPIPYLLLENQVLPLFNRIIIVGACLLFFGLNVYLSENKLHLSESAAPK